MILKKNDVSNLIRQETGIIDCHTHVGVSYKMFLDNAYPYCLSYEDLVIRMKYLGITRSVVFPRGSSFYLMKNTESNDLISVKFSKFPYEKENELLLKEIYETFPEYVNYAIPFLYIDPSRHIDEQAESIESLINKYPVFGLKVCTSYSNSFVSDLNGKGKTFLNIARKHRLPFLLHSSYDLGDPWAQASDIISLAKNNPDVKFCLAHTARFIKSVLDEADKLDNCYVDLSAFSIHCILAKDNDRGIPPVSERFHADYGNPEDVLKRLVKSYPETLIWGTDTPCNYYIGSFTDSSGNRIHENLKSEFDAEIKLLQKLESSDIEKISRENTLAFIFD